jgi:hypothetical protein
MPRRLVATVVAGLMLGGGVVGLAAAPAGAAGGSGASHGLSVGFTRLTGAEEVPGPGDPDGRGTFAYITFGDHLCYVLTARRIEPATMAHIHSGARGLPGPIAINLATPDDGFSSGCITAVDNSTPDSAAVLLRSELAAIVATPENFYANVHNAPFPAGAIRGQLD